MSLKPHEPTEFTRKLVRELFACGITRERIAQRLKICAETLNKHYEEELDDELENMIAAMHQNLYRDALEGCKADREFWLKTRGRFSFHKEPEKQTTAEAILEKVMDRLVAPK